jgi:hypothetical protein
MLLHALLSELVGDLRSISRGQVKELLLRQDLVVNTRNRDTVTIQKLFKRGV